MDNIAIINGAKIHFIDVGTCNSKSVIFIHGFPFSLEIWNPQIELLRKEYRVVAYDVRGLGKSEIGDGQYTMELFIDDLVCLLDHLGIRKTVVCGLSMGGFIALRAVEREPERFDGLILCDTEAFASDERKLQIATRINEVKKLASNLL